MPDMYHAAIRLARLVTTTSRPQRRHAITARKERNPTTAAGEASIMASLLEKLDREHRERQAKWFPQRHPSPAALLPPVIPANPPQSDEPIDLELMRLVRRAEKVELMLAGREPFEEMLPEYKVPSVRHVQRIVAGFYGLAYADLLSQRRHTAIVRPRQMAMYLTYKFWRQTLSLPRIGRRFGGRDHTTVLHAVRKIEHLRETDARTRDELQLLIMCICAATGCDPFEETPGETGEARHG